MKYSFDQSVIVAVLMAFLLMSLACLSLVGIGNLIETAHWVDDTQNVIDRLQTLLTEDEEGSMAMRSFLLTGDPAYRQSFQNVRQVVPFQLQALKELNPARQSDLVKLQELLDQHMAAVEHVAQSGAPGKLPSVAQRAEESNELIAQIKAQITAMQASERLLLQQRMAKTRQSSTVLKSIIVTGAFIGLMALLGGTLSLRHEMAARLRTQRELDRFFTLTSDMFCIAGFDGYFKMLNPAWEKTFGYTRKELLSKPFVEFLHPDDLEKTRREFTRQKSGHEVVSFENRYRCKDGSYRWLLWSAQPLVDEQMIFASARDVTDRKQIEETLRQNEERTRLMIESVKDYAIFMLDPDGRVVSWNPGAEGIKGYRAEEIIGQHFSRFYPKEKIREKFPEKELRVAADKGRVEDEGWRLRKDGSRFWADVIISAVRDAQGELLGFVKLTRDLTERRRSEQALLERQQMFEGLFENSPDAIILVDQAGRIVRANARVDALFGYARADLEGQGVETLMPEGYRARHGGDLAGYFAAPRARPMGLGLELFAMRKDGGEFPVDIMLSPLETGEGSHALAVIRDITARKQIEQALLKNQRMFEALFEYSPDAIILVNRAGRIVRVNARADSLFGYTRAELEGQGVETLMPERYRARHGGDLASYFAAPRVRSKSEGLELFARHKDGSEFPVDIMLSPLETDEGTHALAVIRDITARKEAEGRIQKLNLELKQRADMLEVANKELEAFSYSVSHDLRAPLRHIHGFVELLQKSPALQENEASRRHMNVISTAAKQMGVLIDDLLDFSRTGRAEMHPIEINMREMVDQIIRDRATECQERKVTWKIKPLSGVTGDPNLLRLVWTNLLDNALKYTRPRREAKIEIGQTVREGPEAGARAVIFYVRDNGVGFDMQYASKLFGVFQRLHRAEDFEGTGIGLANVQRIIHRHGGRVWAEGKVDSGATFYFSLPVTAIQPV